MIDVDEALSLVLQHTATGDARRIPVAQSVGLRLAEDVASDVDSPPHDKASMDGYAIVAADLTAGVDEFEILEEVTAGQVPTRTVASGLATRIMTGAPIPTGADAVIMIEKTEELAAASGKNVRIRSAPVSPGKNIMRRATSLRKGEVVLSAGSQIRPIEIGLLCEVGAAEVAVYPRPAVAVLATGNELVPADKIPAAGQIRNSNGPMLCAQVERAGGSATNLGIARDERDELERLISRGLEADALVLSGGVSAGVLDLVPAVLAELGVAQVFHKVRLKPGKPLWFGVLSRDGIERLVFGLPGNPVSSLVCFELFVRAAIERMAGHENPRVAARRARLSKPHEQRGDRPTYWPSMLSQDGESIEPLAWHGSADLKTLSEANSLACFPAGNREYAAGEEVEYRLL